MKHGLTSVLREARWGPVSWGLIEWVEEEGVLILGFVRVFGDVDRDADV